MRRLRNQINRREWAICKRRGHEAVYRGWTQCKWCHVWVREVRRLEERTSEPPEAELDPQECLKRLTKQKSPASSKGNRAR